MAAAIQFGSSQRHADAPSSHRVRLTPEQQAELIRKAEHWLSALEGPGQARLVLDMGQSGLTISGGAGK